MSSTSADQVREQIEVTRARLSGNVDSLADTVNPGHAAKRQVDRVKGVLGEARVKVMGAASDASSAIGQAPSSVTDSVAKAPDMVLDRAAGNPLAAGLIVFGAGWLAGSLLPASSAERQAAASVKNAAAPVIAGAASEIAEHLKEPAEEAVQSVKDAALEAVETVKDDTTRAGQDVAAQVQHSATAIHDQAT